MCLNMADFLSIARGCFLLQTCCIMNGQVANHNAVTQLSLSVSHTRTVTHNVVRLIVYCVNVLMLQYKKCIHQCIYSITIVQ